MYFPNTETPQGREASMPQQPELNQEKLTSSELKSFATQGEAHDTVSVIVELGIPPAKLAPRPHGKLPPPNDEDNLENFTEEDRLMDQLEEELAHLDLAEKPVRLNLAQAFVIELTPEQLRAVSQLPLAGIIRPNRTHQVRSIG